MKRISYIMLISWILIITMTAFPTAISASTPAIILNPDSGTSGTAIAITGSGFAPGVSGNIWFDTNGNGLKDTGEPARAISSTSSGEFPKFTRLTAPKSPGGQYKILADIPGGDSIEGTADFDITPSIALSIKTGYAGASTTVTGSGFAASASGHIWFDTNNNGKRETYEPQIAATTSAAGEIPTGITLITPATGPGNYNILAEIPDGNTAAVSTSFIYSPTLVISPSPVTSNLGAVVMNTIITISVTGGGFTPDSTGNIWFDYNKNDIRDDNESQAAVTIDANGLISDGVTLKTPELPPCSTFNVNADVPGDGAIDASAILSVAETTTAVTINKHDSYGNIISTKTVDWQWMKENLPVIGDGKTDYYIQKGTALSDTFEHVWDPDEIDLDPDTLLEMGCAQGTDVKDLLELAGGAEDCDSILFTASDNWQVWFDTRNIYNPDPRQGKVVLSWWNGSSGGYVPEFYLGMRLYCFAETTNAQGMHLFGDWDMHENIASSRWEYSPIGPCTSRLSNKYVRYIDIYQPNLFPCDASGTSKTQFAQGETVYVKGLGLTANTGYNLWVQPDGVEISPRDSMDLKNGSYSLSPTADPSGSQEKITTDAKGDFTPIAIWQIPTSSGESKGYDIVADSLSTGTAGIYEKTDSVSNIGWEGFTAPSAAATPVDISASTVSSTISAQAENGNNISGSAAANTRPTQSENGLKSTGSQSHTWIILVITAVVLIIIVLAVLINQKKRQLH